MGRRIEAADRNGGMRRVRGRLAQSADNGQAQAMVGTMTLGLSELIVVPYTLVTETKNAFKEYYLYCVFGPGEKILRHGYLPVEEAVRQTPEK